MTTATLRPNGTSTAFDSLGGSPGSSHAATNDDSDTTYGVESLPAGAWLSAWLDMGTTSMAAGSVTKNIRARARVRGHSAFATAAAKVTTSEGGATLASVSIGSVSNSTITNIVGAYTPVTLTQAQVNALMMSAGLAEEGANAVRFYELYIDLIYVEQPSVAVDAVSPDPYTASTVVPISWVNTFDSDGGGQTRYEIKVFTDAQYGDGGFDPDTSTPYYTSGVVVTNPGPFGVGAATSADVGPLETGDTYRAYVRVAQTVNGELHWSDWDYDEFSMNLSTSDIDSVVITPDDANARIHIEANWDSSTENWNYIEIQRSIDGGSTWVDVRGATYVLTIIGQLEFEAYDYESPNGVDAKYRARATYLSSGRPITGSWVESASADSWESSDTWLKVPDDPTLNTTVKLRNLPRLERPRRTGTFRVLGRRTPVVVSDVRGAAEGAITFWFRSDADADAIQDALENPVVLLQAPNEWHRWGSRYLAVAGGVEVYEFDTIQRSERGMIEVQVFEADAPADPDAGR